MDAFASVIPSAILVYAKNSNEKMSQMRKIVSVWNDKKVMPVTMLDALQTSLSISSTKTVRKGVEPITPTAVSNIPSTPRSARVLLDQMMAIKGFEGVITSWEKTARLELR